MAVNGSLKQTELGLFPSDWEVAGLGRSWSVTDCKHVTAPSVANGYPVASIMEVQSRFVDLRGASQTTERFHRLLTEGGRKPRTGDLVLSRNATVGEVAQVADWHPPFAMGQDVCLLRKKSPRFSTNYLQAVFRSPIVVNQLSDLMVGSTFKRANVQQIRNLVVPMPPPVEQEAIAAALSDADALIESLEQLLVKKRHLKQGAMQELLTGKKRLPGFTEAWRNASLGDVTDVDPDNLRSGTRPDLAFKYISLEDVDRGGLVGYSEQVFRTAPSRARRRLRKGDVLISTVRPNLMSHLLFAGDSDDWVCSTGFSVARCRPRVASPGYVYFHMFAGYVARQIETLLTGSNYPAINSRDVRGLRIPLPEYEEQSAIAEVLNDMEAEISALEAKLAKTRQIKQGMMQELLTGRIRLV